MKINRLKYSIAKRPLKLISMSVSMQRHAKKKYSEQTRYRIVKKCMETIFKTGKVSIKVTGLENTENQEKFIILSNHQGKADMLAIINSLNRPISVLIDKAVCTNPFLNSCLNCLNAKKIDKKDPKSAIKLFEEMEREVIEENRSFVIFPEGQHQNNQNHLQEFYTGCLGFIYNTKAPIIPVCLYDTYKVYEVRDTKPVCCEVHYLKPIYYDEYKDLRKKELAELVKQRIQDKLDELDNAH